MSKLEIVKNLADSKNRTLSEMASQIEALQSSLDQLPPAIAAQLMEAIAPLASLPEQVQKALESFDQITEAQRATLGDLADETTRQTVSLMEARLQPLDATIKQAGESVAQLATHFKSVAATTSDLAKIAESLDASAVLMRDSATGILDKLAEDKGKILGEMQALVESVQPPPAWRLPTMLIGCALLGAIGADVLSRFLPPVVVQVPPQVQTQANFAASLWSKATPAERESLNKIVSRPVK